MTGSDWWTAARAIAEEAGSTVRTIGRSNVDPVDGAAFVHRFLLRAGLVIAIGQKGWFKHPEADRYWDGLLCSQDAPYRLDQRLALLYFSGLGQPSERARRLVRTHVGDVPYLGTGLFARDRYESEFDDREEPAVLPEEVVEWIRSQAATRLAEDSAVDQGGLYAAAKPLNGHVFDPCCGSGDRLVDAVRCIVVESDGDGVEIVRAIDERVSGLDEDVLNVQTARARIALLGLTSQNGPDPVPLPDLRRIVRVGTSDARMVAKVGEGPTIEFKSAFDWNRTRQERSHDLQMGVLRTIVAFLNSEGGTLYIGVADDGSVVGIHDELAALSDEHPRDVFEGRIREAVKNHVEPLPLHQLSIRFIQQNGLEIIRIDVSRRAGVTYLVRKGNDGRLTEEIHVRDGNRTLNLSGRARDQFVLSRLLG